MKRKRVWWIVIAVLVVLGVVGIFIWWKLSSGPLAFYSRMQELMKYEFRCNIDCQMDGLDWKIFEKEEGMTVIGEKSDSGFFGEIYCEDKLYLEIYGSRQFDVMFNIAPITHAMLENVDEDMDIKIPFLGLLLPDELYVSLEQIGEITGRTFVSIPETGLTPDLFSDLVKGDTDESEIRIERYKDILPSRKLVGEDADYYKIIVKESGLELAIGNPKSLDVKKLSAEIVYQGVTWQMVADYEICEVEDTSVPKASLSEEVIGFLKKIYGLWEGAKEKI